MSFLGPFGRLLRQNGGGARKLPDLKSQLSAAFSGRRTLVIGSAPDLILPSAGRYDAVICVNGSGRPARDQGLTRPDLTIIGGYSTRGDNDVRLKTQAAWQGLETQALLFVASGQTARKGKGVIARAGLKFETFMGVSVEERAVIVAEVCREDLARGELEDRISMGAFAAIVALWAGATEAILSGFSLGGGHSYIEGETPRLHIGGDSRFFELVSQIPLPVATTDAEIQRKFCLCAA